MNTRARLSRPKLSFPISFAFLAAVLPSVAGAHPQHDLMSSFAIGLTHPLHGLDHLVAAIGSGVLLAWFSRSGVKRWYALLGWICASATLIAAVAHGFADAAESPPTNAFAIGLLISTVTLQLGGFIATRFAVVRAQRRAPVDAEVSPNRIAKDAE
jgi:hydrogenase/urease accessory protein HupE